MRIHVFEFICGGGLVGAPLPAALAHEGELMLTALLGDLLELPDVQVSYARDARLPPLDDPRLTRARVCWREPGQRPEAALEREMQTADAVWCVAPETNGQLEAVARAVRAAGRRWIGSDADAIAVAASKATTSRHLLMAGIKAVPSYGCGTAWPASSTLEEQRWVIKPDDGVGCTGLRLVRGASEARAMLQEAGVGWIAQPWVDGQAASLCVVCGGNQVDVLSVNRQHLKKNDGAVELAAIDVNCEPVTRSLHRLAERILTAIPGLMGYFGIDFIHTTTGPVVVEINPRLTTSYVALGRALGINVAERVLAACGGAPLAPRRAEAGRCVRVSIDHE